MSVRTELNIYNTFRVASCKFLFCTVVCQRARTRVCVCVRARARAPFDVFHVFISVF